MTTCWAACLNNCSEESSREHIVSDSLFTAKKVMVQGFKWCEKEPKEIGLANLTSKILCRKHNSDLSDVDQEGSKAFDKFRQAALLNNNRLAIKPRIWRVKTYSVDGIFLQRWFLKTLINVSFGGEFPIGRELQERECVAQRLVAVAFGLSRFEGGAGLYMMGHVGEHIDLMEKVRIVPLIDARGFITGGLFSFYGFRFLLFVEPEGPTQSAQDIGMNNKEWPLSQLVFHVRALRWEVKGHLSHVVEIRW